MNPQSERVAGIIGLGLLRRFTPTLDFARQRLVLRRPGVAFAPAAGAQRVPFELWGENELMVWGSISGGRRLAMVVQTGVPACGLGAPQEVCDEFGLRAGPVARAMKRGHLDRRTAVDRGHRPRGERGARRDRQGAGLDRRARLLGAVAPRGAPRRAAVARLLPRPPAA